MTLTARLSLFFLAALAVILLGFSVALYLLTGARLYRETDNHVMAVLNTLAAAAQMDENGIEWKPQERPPSFASDTADRNTCWSVFDESGGIIERSANPAADSLSAATADARWQTVQTVDWQDGRWRIAQRRLTARSYRPGKQEEDERKFPAISIAAAASLIPVQRALANLRWALIGLSVLFWGLAALLGRRVCRRALRPVTQMASTARQMNATDLDRRLPDPGTRDELANLGDAFNDLLDRLQESFQRQQRFAGDASHQLRTPLTIMLGQIDVALRRERDPEEYRRVLELIQGQSKRLHEIIEALLFLSRADAESELPDLQTLDLSSWLGEHLQSWSSHPRFSDIQFVSTSGESIPAKVHPGLLGQLIDNLIDNAAKHSSAASAIEVRLSRENDSASVRVKDAGSGIGAEDLPHVFEPFYRSSEARRKAIGGIGLGLAIAHRIATSLGGTLHVMSEVAKGSEFALTLPLVSESSQQASAPIQIAENVTSK